MKGPFTRVSAVAEKVIAGNVLDLDKARVKQSDALREQRVWT